MNRAKSIFQSAKVISASTLLSRILGLTRDIISSDVFGNSPEWGAFSFAFIIPNLFRRLFGEGALAASFIPTFTEYIQKKNHREAVRLFQVVSTALIILLALILLAGELICVALLGFAPLKENGRLIVMLMVLLLPYLLFICYAAFLAGAENSLEHFLAPAMMPVALNIMWICGVIFASRLVGGSPSRQVMIMSAAIVAGGILQVSLQLPYLYRKGFRLRFVLDLLHPGLRRVAMNMAPLIIGLSAFQINTLMDNVIGRWFAGETAPASLYWANRLFQFPLALLGIPIAVAIFPRLSRLASRGDSEGLSRELLRALRMVLYLSLPATVGLIIIRKPLIELIYEHGRFTAADTGVIAGVTLAYVIGLAAVCTTHIVTRLFYSTGDTRTPMKVAAFMVAANLPLNIVLVIKFGVMGVALATSICGVAQALLLLRGAGRKLRELRYKTLARPLVRQVFSSIAMGAVTYFSLSLLPVHPEGLFMQVAKVILPTAVGAGFYLLVGWITRAEEIKEVFRRR